MARSGTARPAGLIPNQDWETGSTPLTRRPSAQPPLSHETLSGSIGGSSWPTFTPLCLSASSERMDLLISLHVCLFQGHDCLFSGFFSMACAHFLLSFISFPVCLVSFLLSPFVAFLTFDLNNLTLHTAVQGQNGGVALGLQTQICCVMFFK